MEATTSKVILTVIAIIAIYFAITSYNRKRKNQKYWRKLHFLDELYMLANNHKGYVGSGAEGDKDLFLTINSMSIEELKSISEHLKFYIYHFTLSCQNIRHFFESQAKWINDQRMRIYLTDMFNRIIFISGGENLSKIYLSGLELMFNNNREFTFKEEMEAIATHAEHRTGFVRKPFCKIVNAKFDELISLPETSEDDVVLLKMEKIHFNLNFPEYDKSEKLTK